MHAYPDEKASTEAVLRAYSDVVLDRQKRREELMDMVTETPCSSEPPGKIKGASGGGSSQQERFVMALEKDRRLLRDEQIIRVIKNGQAELCSTHSKILRAIYFQDMKPIEAARALKLSIGYVRRVADEVKELMCLCCVQVYPLVCEFRQEQREHRSALLRKAEEREV